MFKGLKALLAGILAGTALGILFSPKKGDEIRKNFKKEFKQGGLGLNTLKDTLVKIGTEISDSAKETYKEIEETDLYQEGLKKAKKYSGEAKDKAMKVINEKTTPGQRARAKRVIKKAAKTVKSKAAQAKKTVDKAAEIMKNKAEQAKKTLNRAAEKVVEKTK